MGMAGSACAVTGSVWRPDESATDGRISTRRPAVPRLLPASRPLRRSRPPVLPRFQTWDGVCRTSCPTPTKGDARVPADLDSFLLGTDEQERRCSFATNGAVCDHALRPSLHCCYGRAASVPAGERLTLASSERSGSTGCGERDAWTSSEATVGSGSSGATASDSKRLARSLVDVAGQGFGPLFVVKKPPLWKFTLSACRAASSGPPPERALRRALRSTLTACRSARRRR